MPGDGQGAAGGTRSRSIGPAAAGRSRPPWRLIAALAVLPLVPTELPAQLRPLDPLDAAWYDAEDGFRLEVGAALFDGQRASLIGAEGRLLELATLRVLWVRDRVALEAAGSALRRFREASVFADPTGGAQPPDGRPRLDAGDFRLATVLTLLSRPGTTLVLRFGTRLPTTDNGAGLERDQTDFFALVGSRVRRDRLSVAVESGVGIHGTRNVTDEQVDVWLYAASVGYEFGAVVPSLSLVGHDGLRNWEIRGNEDLAELRGGVQIGAERWVRVVGVRGLTDFSAAAGLMVSVGAAF